MRLAEYKKIVPILNSANYGGAVTLDSINMRDFHRACIIMTFGAITGNSDLLVYSGIGDGVMTSTLPFDYAVGGGAIAAANSDRLAAATTATAASGITLTAGTYASHMLVIEVDAAAMDMENSEEWLTLIIDATATSGICHAIAVLDTRYGGNRSLSALA